MINRKDRKTVRIPNRKVRRKARIQNRQKNRKHWKEKKVKRQKSKNSEQSWTKTKFIPWIISTRSIAVSSRNVIMMPLVLTCNFVTGASFFKISETKFDVNPLSKKSVKLYFGIMEEDEEQEAGAKNKGIKGKKNKKGSSKSSKKSSKSSKKGKGKKGKKEKDQHYYVAKYNILLGNCTLLKDIIVIGNFSWINWKLRHLRVFFLCYVDYEAEMWLSLWNYYEISFARTKK